MRFDDRVTGNLETYAPQREEDPRRARPGGDQQERPRRPRARRRRDGDARVAPHARHEAACAAAGSTRIGELKGDAAVRDIQQMPRRRPPLRRARHARPVAASPRARRSSSPTSASTRCGRRSTTSTTTRGSSSPPAASARWASRCPPPSARASRMPDEEIWVIVGDGGFQMTACRARHLRAGGHQGQHRHHQQRLPRHGPPVAAVLLRRALRRRRPLRSPDFVKLAEAHGLTGLRVTKRAEVAERRRAGARRRRAPSSSTSASSRKTASTRWCPPAPTSTT